MTKKKKKKNKRKRRIIWRELTYNFYDAEDRVVPHLTTDQRQITTCQDPRAMAAFRPHNDLRQRIGAVLADWRPSDAI